MLELRKYAVTALVLVSVAYNAKALGDGKLMGGREVELKASSYLLKQSVTMSGTYTLKCSSDPPYPELSSADLTKKLGIKHANEIGVGVRFTQKPVELHKFQLQILAGAKVVFSTEQSCVGCMKTYEAAGDKKPNSCYLFVLDPKAAAAAEKVFLPKNTIRLLVTGHKGGIATFYFVKATDYKVSGVTSSAVSASK